MSDRRRSNSTLGADDRDHPPKRLGPRHGEQLGHRLNELDDAERGDQIFADPARDELPIENDVVELAEDDYLGPGVAILRQLLELLEQRVSACGSLEDHHVRRRRALIGFNRGRRAAHVQLDMRLGHSAIGYGGADDSGDIGRFAERLDRYARHRIDLRDGASHLRPIVGSGAGVKRLHRSLSLVANLRPDRGQLSVAPPLRARILAVVDALFAADGLDGSGAHGDIGWP